ncbi:MAG: type II toxin-antitoxin system VapC family toxin [Epsilonproteobacteria bacterium]|nr:type II toxin-antitoxin system VapC family toxin [Campylobacterota bacterium]
MLGNKVFTDTCIIIEYLKNNIELEKSNCYINHIVLMELYIGAKNKQDLVEIKAKLQGFKILEIDKNVIDLSTQIIEHFGLSHGAKIQDSIIASTCLINNLPICTYNIKDFRYIPNLEIVNIRKIIPIKIN